MFGRIFLCHFACHRLLEGHIQQLDTVEALALYFNTSVVSYIQEGIPCRRVNEQIYAEEKEHSFLCNQHRNENRKKCRERSHIFNFTIPLRHLWMEANLLRC